MNLYPVFVPKLLSTKEPFVSGSGSCPGCGQASAVRIISKALEETGRYPYGGASVNLKSSVFPYSEWVFTPPKVRIGKGNKLSKTLLAVATESSCFEKGYEALKDAKNRGRQLLYICFFNEAGIERHSGQAGENTYCNDQTKSATGRYSDINKKMNTIKALKLDFFATACSSYPMDLVDKVKKAVKSGSAGFLAVLVPCPTGCGYDPALSQLSGRMAVETGFFPLYQYDSKNSPVMTVNLDCILPVREYLKLHPEYVLLDGKNIDKLQGNIDKNMKRLL